MTIILNYLSGQLFISVSFSSFSEFCLVSFGTYTFFSSFGLNLCVCFYVLGGSAVSPGLEGVALCRKLPEEHKRAIPSGHRARHLRGIPGMGPVYSSVVAVPWSLWVC